MSFARIFKALPVCTALFILAFSVSALARPEMTGQTSEERFTAMDADKDGKVSREEFFAAQPQMKEGAFTAIDANTDGFITLEEWKAFISGHAMGNDGARPGMDKRSREGAAASSRGTMRPAAAHNATGKAGQ